MKIILDVIKNIRDSWGNVKISTLAAVWKKFIPGIMNDFEGLRSSVEEWTTDVVEIAGELELEEEIMVCLSGCNLMMKL